jgi:hypothetical protein
MFRPVGCLSFVHALWLTDREVAQIIKVCVATTEPDP